MKRKVYFICLLVILYFVTSFSISTFKKENVIYFGETTKVIVSKNSFKIVDDNKKINNKKVKILFNNKFIDAYLYSSNDFNYNRIIYYAITENKEKLSLYNNLLAYSNDVNTKFYDLTIYNNIYSEDETLIREFISEKNLSLDNISNIKRISFDLDKDSKKENIYTISIIENKYFYTYNFIVDDEINVISESMDKNASVKKKYDNIYKIIDINNDNNYEIVMVRNNGEDEALTYRFYKYVNGEVVRIK